MKHLYVICALAATLMGFIGCSVHDPSYDDVTPPKLDLSGKITLSGQVTDKAGNPLKGAIVKLDAFGEVTTDEEGYYSKEINATGVFLLNASYTGKIPSEKEVTVEKKRGAQNIITNFVLSEEVEAIFIDQGSVQTEVIEHNVKGIVTISGVVVSPVPTVHFTLTPFYNYSEVENKTKAALTKGELRVRKPLVGVTLESSSSDGSQNVSKPTLTMDIFHPLLYEYVSTEYWSGTEWVPVSYRQTEEGMVFDDAVPGSYVCSYPVGITYKNTSIELEVVPASVNNLYGERDTTVKAIITTYMSGVLVDTYQGTDQSKALLLERLAMDYGLTSLVKKNAIAVNVTIPKGTALDVKAYQECLEVTYYLDKEENGVSAQIFGNYEVNAYGYNRRHTGGGSL